jgi:hypothetical protein
VYRYGRVAVDVERPELVQDAVRRRLFDIELNSIAGWLMPITHDHYV